MREIGGATWAHGVRIEARDHPHDGGVCRTYMLKPDQGAANYVDFHIGPADVAPNGVTPQALIVVLIDHLRMLQAGAPWSWEHTMALTKLEGALQFLDAGDLALAGGQGDV